MLATYYSLAAVAVAVDAAFFSFNIIFIHASHIDEAVVNVVVIIGGTLVGPW